MHDLSTGVQVGLLWAGALVLTQIDGGSLATNELHSDLAASLMWLGNVWYFLLNLKRPWCDARDARP